MGAEVTVRARKEHPCTLIRFYASMHLAAATQNFFKVENALGGVPRE